MLSIVAIQTIHPVPGWQKSKLIVIEDPMRAELLDEGVLLLDAARRIGGGRHLLVPLSNIACIELDLVPAAEDVEPINCPINCDGLV
jgi:hypothetical protein